MYVYLLLCECENVTYAESDAESAVASVCHCVNISHKVCETLVFFDEPIKCNQQSSGQDEGSGQVDQHLCCLVVVHTSHQYWIDHVYHTNFSKKERETKR